jgi:hypothetical protein
MVAIAGDDEGGVDHQEEKRGERKRERKRREKEEEVSDGLSFGLVTPNGLASLSRAVCSGVTEAQVAHGEWPVSLSYIVFYAKTKYSSYA